MSVLDGYGRKPERPARPVLQTHEESDCCGRALDRALAAGLLSEEWGCPKCGETWRYEVIAGAHHWTMRPAFFVGFGRKR